MIAPEFEGFLLSHIDNYLVPAQDLAIFVDTHNTDHVMLLLASNGYSRVPVITKDNKYVGTISISDIIAFELEHRLSDEALSRMEIAPMVSHRVDTISDETSLTEVMHKLVDNSFLPVITEDNTFVGIITRRTILKAVNALLHDFTNAYVISEREEATKE